MAGAAVLGRLSWLTAEVTEIIPETASVRTIGLHVPGWPGHRPGQHVDIRLTAEDGYQAQRSYSIANPPDGERLELTIEYIADGEVSPFLVDEVRVGDRFELRGPVGGYFVWSPDRGGPLQLVAGGSGVVPLMAMIRANALVSDPAQARLIYSARTADDLIYRQELDELSAADHLQLAYTLTRAHPPGWTGFARRVDRALLEEAAWPPDSEPHVYVCGPTGFVESVADTLVAVGHPAAKVKTERFGPSGGVST